SAFQSVLVYHVVVGDWPDPSDYEGGIEQLRIDSSLPDYVGLLFESDAYLALHGPAPDLATANPQQYSRVSAFATDLYKNNLGRAPTLVEVQAFFNGVSTAGVNATVANFITANFITGSNPTMTAAVRAAALYVALTQSQPTADDVVALAAEPLATAAAAVLADSLYVNRFLSISRQPDDLALAAGGDGVLSVEAMGPEPFAYQWYFNGTPLAGATNAALELHNVGAGDSGVYYAVVTNATSRVASRSATVAVAPAVTLASGAGVVIATNVVHPNGNHFDQVLATGPVETIFAAAGRITRTSFIDLNDDIVQVEFSGAGSLTLVLDAASGPAAPVNYNQPDVYYMRGHAGIVITGADETTNVTIFAVGRATAFDPTGRYDILQPPSSANDPANNGSPLFQGHAATRYDSFADLAFVAISTTDGKFGGLRTANTHYFGSSGLTGVYAPGVSFQGPLFIGDIDAFDTATPVIEVGSVADARITGGSMAQENHLPVQVSGLSRLTFTAGQNASGDVMPAQDNAAVLLQDGQDVTTRIVVKQ
ncbi:MAG TPA: immunoglobulin domain-containing protein, partial [Opitutus sp.]|nr:immunoglobulin domain-containing protein [Opitutus sp.]